MTQPAWRNPPPTSVLPRPSIPSSTSSRHTDASSLKRYGPTYSDYKLDEWFSVNFLEKDTWLDLHTDCEYEAHAALRHAKEIDLQGYALSVQVPDKYMNGKGFMPWLSSASSMKPEKQIQSVCVLFTSSNQRVVAADGPGHFTTLDIRVGGMNIRALLDSGATCSCMSGKFAKSIGVQLTSDTKRIGGIDGVVGTLGTCVTDVKVRKYHTEQFFQVLNDPIAGYDVLLGQDFWRANSLGVQFENDQLQLNLGTGDHRIEIKQALSNFRSVDIKRDPNSALPLRLKTITRTELTGVSLSVDKGTSSISVMSRSQHSKNRKKVRNKQQVAYRICFAMDKPEPAGSQEVPDSIQKVIDKHRTSGGTLCGTIPNNTHAKGFDCKIQLQPGAQPVYIRQYRLTPLEKSELLRQVDEFIKKGWLEKSTSAWSSSVLFIPKPNNKLRFCMDYRKVNEVTSPDRNPLANQAELLDSLQGMTYFSALDLASGYYQLEMNKESRPVTAFQTPYGLMQWRVMPMGLSTAPAIFQQAMNSILREHIRNGICLVYLDDIIIMSRNLTDHEKHLDSVLSTLHSHNLFCQLPKCFWAQTEIKYLGHLVDGLGVRPDPAKVDTLDKWKPPTAKAMMLADSSLPSSVHKATKRAIVKECRRFIGFMNYFNRFIPRFSALAAPLTDQTKDDAPPWRAECTTSWIAMCTALKHATLMYHPIPDKEFHVYSDASIRGVGGVLMQYHDDKLHPVAYCARKMIPAETRYGTTEQELLAMVYCFLKWRFYLEGSPKVYMHTDHEPLTWIKTQAAINRRLSHWLEFMSRFSYQVLYVKGDKNVVADALTRMIELPEYDQPDLRAELWPHVVANLTVLPVCSGHETGDVTTPTGAATQASSVGRSVQAVECGSPLPDPKSESGRSPGRIPNSPGDHSVAGVSPLPNVCAGGFTRRVGQRSLSGGKTAGVLPSPVSRKRKILIDGKSDRSSPAVSKSLLNKSGRVKHVKFKLRSNDSGENSKTRDDYPSGPVEPKDSLDPAYHEYDRLYETLFDRIKKGLRFDANTSTKEAQSKLDLQEVNDLLWKKNKLYIPPGDNLRNDILYWHHDVPWCAHLGIEKTLNMLNKQFWWPKMEQDIRDYIRSCKDCQTNKVDRISRTPLLSPLVPPETCWHTIGVDLIVDLPPTREGKYNAICVFVCHLSKMVRLVPTDKELDAIGFGKLFFKEVFAHYGMPERIISDNGSTWKNEFFQSLCTTAGIQMRLSTAYHPQTNGLVERTNEVVETALRHYVSANHDDWHSYLPLVEFALNSAYHKSLECTPFQMNRMTIPKNPFDVLIKPGSKDSIHTTAARWMGVSQLQAENGIRTMAQAHSQFDWARKCVHIAKMKMKEQHDKKLTANHLYEPGDRVWFNIRNLKLKHPSTRLKFLPKFMGPLLILEVVGRSAVRLDFPTGMQIHPTVSTSLVKPFHPRTDHQLPPVNIEGIEEFEVTDIISHNILKSKRKDGLNLIEFLVRWKGSYEDSWEEFKDFAHSMDMINSYLSTECNKAVRKSMYSVLSPSDQAQLSKSLQEEAKVHMRSMN